MTVGIPAQRLGRGGEPGVEQRARRRRAGEERDLDALRRGMRQRAGRRDGGWLGQQCCDLRRGLGHAGARPRCSRAPLMPSRPGMSTRRCSLRSMTRSCMPTRPPRMPLRGCRNRFSVASLRCPPCGVGGPGRGTLSGGLARLIRRSITPPGFGRQDFPYHDYDENYRYEEREQATSGRAAETHLAARRPARTRPQGRQKERPAPARGTGRAGAGPRACRAGWQDGQLGWAELGPRQSHSMSSSKRPGQCRRYSSTSPAKCSRIR